MGDWFGPFLAGGGAVGVITAISVLIHRWYVARGSLAKDTAQAAKDTAEAGVITTGAEIDVVRVEAEIQDRRDAIAIRELRRSQELMRQDRELDRKEIHDLRGELGVVKQQLTLCQIDCARKDARIDALVENVRQLRHQLGMDDPTPEGPKSGKMTLQPPPSEGDDG